MGGVKPATKSDGGFVKLDEDSQHDAHNENSYLHKMADKKLSSKDLKTNKLTSTVNQKAQSTTVNSMSVFTVPSSLSSQKHIKIIYAALVCLSVFFLSLLTLCFIQIKTLNQEINNQKQIVTQLLDEIRHPSQRPMHSSKFAPFGYHSEGQPQRWDVSSSNGRASSRHKRHASETSRRDDSHVRRRTSSRNTERTGDGDFFTVSAKLPMDVVHRYCKQTQHYCQAHGSPGLPGPKGDKGDSVVQRNVRGREMIQGPPGPKGDMGQKGERGHHGHPGQHGPKGIKGSAGDPGRIGYPGTAGRQGLTGEPGVRGPLGPRGPKGEQGEKGNEGLHGAPGRPGKTGAHGVTGYKGQKGEPGYCCHRARGHRGEKGNAGHCLQHCHPSDIPPTTPFATTSAPKTLPPRSKECQLKMVGKPVYLRNAHVSTGTFMMDSQPDATTRGKVWMTLGLNGSSVIEFADWNAFTSNTSNRTLNLNNAPFFGTGHTVYNGCFYYHQKDTANIVRYNISMQQATMVKQMKDAIFRPNQNNAGYLYQSQNSFFDFSVDSNGLWVVYGHIKTNKLVVALLDLKYFEVVKNIQISIDVGSKGNAFVACGRLYTLADFNVRQTTLDQEIDLWTETSRPISLKFGNPFGATQMIAFDSKQAKLLTWDNAVQLSVPVLVSGV